LLSARVESSPPSTPRTVSLWQGASLGEVQVESQRAPLSRQNTFVITKKKALNLATFRAGVLDALIKDQVLLVTVAVAACCRGIFGGIPRSTWSLFCLRYASAVPFCVFLLQGVMENAGVRLVNDIEGDAKTTFSRIARKTQYEGSKEDAINRVKPPPPLSYSCLLITLSILPSSSHSLGISNLVLPEYVLYVYLCATQGIFFHALSLPIMLFPSLPSSVLAAG
jgi:hypothetical protein